MKENTKSRIELFWMNTQRLKGKFVWQNVMLKRLAALLYAAQDREVDDVAIRESHDLIKRNTSKLSSFRGNSAMSLSALLALHDSRDSQLAETIHVYDLMKASGFKASDYLVIAAYQVAANAGREGYSHTIERAKAFYDGMKARHYFITGHNDYIYAAMLGLSDVEVHAGLERMEQLYEALKPEFRSADALQALTQVLVLSGDNEGIETHLLDLRDAFKKRGMRLDRQHTLSSLGLLSLLPAEPGTLADEVIEAYESLRAKAGFGQWSVTRQELLLFASALIALGYVDDAKQGILETAISTSLTNIIIAEQTAIFVAAASSAAASSSSGSS